MVTEEVLKEGIEYCRIGEPTPEKMVRLAAYMTVRDHLFGEPEPTRTYSMQSAQKDQTETIDTSCSSDFLWAVRGKDAVKVMDIMDEFMDTMKVIQPRIYDSVMRRVSEIK